MAKEEIQTLVIDKCNVKTVAKQFSTILKDVPTCDQAEMDIKVRDLVEFMQELPNGTAMLEAFKTRLGKLIDKIDAYNKEPIKSFMANVSSGKSVIIGGVRLTRTEKEDYDFTSDEEYMRLLGEKSDREAEAKAAAEKVKNREGVLKALIKADKDTYGHMVSESYVKSVSGSLL